jgi:hypothetical protein
MKMTAFNATCPFEVGDRIRDAATGAQRTITDIACVHYVKSGRIDFLFELDNSGKFVALVKLDTDTAQSIVFAL